MNQNSNNNQLGAIEWVAQEYETQERSSDWFWGLGAFAFFAVIISFIMGNLLFALIIIISAFTIYLFEIRPPKDVIIKLTPKGIQIDSSLYPYEKIKYFWIEIERKGPPMLIFHYERLAFPIVHVSLSDTSLDKVRAYLHKAKVEEEEHVKTLAEEVSDWLGF